MTEVAWKQCRVPISKDVLSWLDAPSMSAWAEVMQREMEQTVLDLLDGPRLGPGRRELNAILAPEIRRSAVRAMLAAEMPGRTPGRFVRAA